MPVLEKIIVQNFRNIELQEMDFSPNVNCLSGDNGEGKTNLLDAIWYLSMTKSAFNSSDRYNYRFGCREFGLAGTYKMENGLTSKVAIKVGEGGKELRRDEKLYDKLSAHIGEIPIVMVSPSDTFLVSENGEYRRRFFNALLSQMDRSYLSDVQNYNRLLAARNTALRNGNDDPGLYEALDYQLQEYGGRIAACRSSAVEKIAPAAQKYYGLLSSESEKIWIEYRSDVHKGPLGALLAQSLEKDKILKYTGVGVQRDDFIFTMDSHPIRKCGSQGQQKSFLVALKFAQYELMKQRYGFPPILLLDDLFDKLDMKRVQSLLKMVSGQDFGQIFLSDSNKVRIAGLLEEIGSAAVCYEAKGGAFTRYE
ncbi:MAG: DNA replication and repair protein RecF [Bacteroidales bacterium]|nr:DNA replication and repair protein RecF [Bacteroidales bacterium]